MSNNIEWSFMDWEADTYVTRRDRPHIGQSALTFVTFRLVDSMPKEVIQRWRDNQVGWLHQNGYKQFDIERALQRGVLPENLRRQFLKMRNQGWHQSLDQAHGECLLRDSNCAQIVAESLLKFDNDRYDLDRFVIMPNHVHVLVQMRKDWLLQEQCTGWLRFTGREINKFLCRQGRVWQPEPFDHVVRNHRQFEYLQNYIVDNPKKAGLKLGEYLLWVR